MCVFFFLWFAYLNQNPKCLHNCNYLLNFFPFHLLYFFLAIYLLKKLGHLSPNLDFAHCISVMLFNTFLCPLYSRKFLITDLILQLYTGKLLKVFNHQTQSLEDGIISSLVYVSCIRRLNFGWTMLPKWFSTLKITKWKFQIWVGYLYFQVLRIWVETWGLQQGTRRV